MKQAAVISTEMYKIRGTTYRERRHVSPSTTPWLRLEAVHYDVLTIQKDVHDEDTQKALRNRYDS